MIDVRFILRARDISIMVMQMTFNHSYIGSNLICLSRRLSFNGRTSVFRTEDVGSIPTRRSSILADILITMNI
jgi:hypothetical protein